MITRVEAYGFRCLREVTQSLRPFQILVGPNASGKSAFMDVLAFLSTLVAEGLQGAASERSTNFHDLVWGRGGYEFQLAVEARPPDRQSAGAKLLEHVTEGKSAGVGNPPPVHAVDTQVVPGRKIRYEVKLRVDPETDQMFIAEERVMVEAPSSGDLVRIASRGRYGAHLTSEDGHPDQALTVVGSDYSVLRLVPSTGADNPLKVWLRNLLADGIQRVSLDAEKLRNPSPPYYGKIDTFDGSQLPRLVTQLEEKSPQSFSDWLSHVQTALPDLEGIRVVVRPEDQHRYLMLRYKNGVELPSWTISEGTLRLLALTILAYMPEANRSYLVEEPENGLHPTALETVYQSLSSIYDGQVLMATHSPILLAVAKSEELLCFTRTAEGTQIVGALQHPRLQDWKGEVSLGELFAAGVLD
jgi:predicted ATPase